MRWLLKWCGVYDNEYYNYLKNTKCEYFQNKQSIKNKTKDIFHSTGGVVVHRGMVISLARKDIKLSKTIIHKYMNQELQLYSIPAKNRQRYIEGTKHEIVPNYLSQDFDIEEKNTVWCTDLTYIRG